MRWLESERPLSISSSSPFMLNMIFAIFVITMDNGRASVHSAEARWSQQLALIDLSDWFGIVCLAVHVGHLHADSAGSLLFSFITRSTHPWQ